MPDQKRTPTVRARQLGLDLRRLRTEAGLSAEEAAGLVGCSQGKISRIELAQSGVSKGDLFLILKTYNVPEETHEQFWQLAREGRGRGWWEDYRHVITGGLSTYIAFEAEATAVNSWNWGFMPGLLQTEGYARALFASDPRRVDPDEIDRLVDARMARQVRLTDGSLSLWVVLDESLLHRPIGGPKVFAEQLDRLAHPSPEVTVQILKQQTVWHFGLGGGFSVMSFPEHPSIVFTESLTGDSHVEQEDYVSRYTLAFDHLRAVATGPDESRTAIERARDYWMKEG
ncbi:helix-turn-helix transcriptional regulator [Micromonospora sp. NBC_01699]|uniref:helix-turn-helix domain-containing protein n=1 Tax=Micromonospora sp. NBC_01699 TaxID=2975984 RepID=UPI002E31CC16|nr:helix-turn-helix transcriptional regulator [Micromonospora sp. NBC_01699]